VGPRVGLEGCGKPPQLVVSLYTDYAIPAHQIRLMNWYILVPHYSHCYIPAGFSPQWAILRECWYMSWAGSTKCVSRCKYLL